MLIVIKQFIHFFFFWHCQGTNTLTMAMICSVVSRASFFFRSRHCLSLSLSLSLTLSTIAHTFLFAFWSIRSFNNRTRQKKEENFFFEFSILFKMMFSKIIAIIIIRYFLLKNPSILFVIVFSYFQFPFFI